MNDIRVNLWLSCVVPFASRYFAKLGVYRYPPESSPCSLYCCSHYQELLSTIADLVGEKRSHFIQRQEGVRKDVERVFGVLQACFTVVRGPAKIWDPETLWEVMTCYVIMHNMIMKDESEDTAREKIINLLTMDTTPAPCVIAKVKLIRVCKLTRQHVQADVETQGDFVRTLVAEVRDATFASIEDVVAFVTWLDEELSFLVDEQAVLKHFDWPEKRADALRDAAARYQGLLQLEKQISSFVDDRALHRDAALGKMYSLFEKTEKSVHKFLQDRDAADTKNNLISRYKEQDIPVGWMADAGLIVKVKLACVNLAKQYMTRVVSEIDGLRGINKDHTRETAFFKRLKEQNSEVLLHQGVRFAFRVHQFTGGFTAQSLGAFDELKRRHNDGTT
uniref:Uncharacterized protein n=1 Tax=Aegilops tauschii TaxID=37682 RepID=R7WDK4_AEGTA